MISKLCAIFNRSRNTASRFLNTKVSLVPPINLCNLTLALRRDSDEIAVERSRPGGLIIPAHPGEGHDICGLPGLTSGVFTEMRFSDHQMRGGPSTTIVFRRSIGVSFHSPWRFFPGTFSAGADGEVDSGNAAVFVSVEPGLTTIVAILADAPLASLTGVVGVFAAVTGSAVIRGVVGSTTAVASAGPATNGISSAETVGVEPAGTAITTVGDGIDRTSEANTSDDTAVSEESTGIG